MTPRELLEDWKRRFGGGMLPFDFAYQESREARGTDAEAQQAGAYALLEAFVEELEDQEREPTKLFAVCWQDASEPWGWEPQKFFWSRDEAETALPAEIGDAANAAVESTARLPRVSTTFEQERAWAAQEHSVQEYVLPPLRGPREETG